MKRNEQFYLADVAGEHYLVPLGKTASEFNGIIRLNDMGVVIWKLLEKDMTHEQLVTAVTEEYDVAPEKAMDDIQKYAEALHSVGALEI